METVDNVVVVGAGADGVDEVDGGTSEGGWGLESTEHGSTASAGGDSMGEAVFCDETAAHSVDEQEIISSRLGVSCCFAASDGISSRLGSGSILASL